MAVDVRDAMQALRLGLGRIGIKADVDATNPVVIEIQLGTQRPVKLRVTTDPSDIGPDALYAGRHIPTELKDQLGHGLGGWIDHQSMRLSADGMLIVAEQGLPAPSRDQRRLNVLAGPAISAAVIDALVCWPDPGTGVRALARQANVNPGSISRANHRLVEAGLLTEDLRATSSLFWAAARDWKPTWHKEIDVTSVDHLDVSDHVAAAAGAPVIVGNRSPTHVLVQNNTAVGLASLAYLPGGPEAVAAVAPSGHIFNTASSSAVEVVHAALVLAIDPGRGTEIVETWEGTHVWHA